VLKKFSDYNFRDLKVLVRVDYNVPLNDNYEIQDTTRIDESLPTIRKIIDDGGMPILMSHLGRPKGIYEEKYSLKHLVDYLSDNIQAPVVFAQDCVEDWAMDAMDLCPKGGIVLLENLRFHKEEEKGDLGFALSLSQLGDFYVNDAFGTAHRAHASTAIIAQFFKGKCSFGFLIEKELEALSKILDQPERPMVAILGGAKVSDKLGVIERLLQITDVLIIGGGMAYSFLVSQNYSVGRSLIESDKLDIFLNLLNSSKKLGKKIILPVDSVCNNEFSENGDIRVFEHEFGIKEGYMGLDIGPSSIELFIQEIKKAKTILWNGPMGVFEFNRFRTGTETIAKAVVAATEFGAYSVVGGGDSVSAVSQVGLKDRISYVSTGGGAMLKFIEGRKLPGIEAIKENA